MGQKYDCRNNTTAVERPLNLSHITEVIRRLIVVHVARIVESLVRVDRAADRRQEIDAPCECPDLVSATRANLEFHGSHRSIALVIITRGPLSCA